MIELRSKCHGAEVSEVKAHLAESCYVCDKCMTMCEISIVGVDFDPEEKGRELFGWGADPHTIGECVSWIKTLLKELNISNGK